VYGLGEGFCPGGDFVRTPAAATLRWFERHRVLCAGRGPLVTAVRRRHGDRVVTCISAGSRGVSAPARRRYFNGLVAR